jgi:hypothetical protein
LNHSTEILPPELPGKAAEELAMRTSDAKHDLEVRAAAALKAVLAEVSTIKVREIRHQGPETGSDRGLTACVDVFGHRHTLACGVESDGQPGHVRSALEELRLGAARLPGDAMPVIIAPYLSPEAQAVCKENKAGFLDLEGNARLALGEVFIVKQSLPHRINGRRTAGTWPARTGVAGKFAAAPGSTRRAEA